MRKHELRRRDRRRSEELVGQAADLIRTLSSSHPRCVARRKRKRRVLARVLKAALAMMIATFVIIPAMIAGGFLLGPRGIEGVFAAPLVLLATWALILYVTFRRKKTAKTLIKADVAQLPLQTEEWLEEQRGRLPRGAQDKLDDLAVRLVALTPQVQSLPADTPSAMELRRLLGEELPDLIRGYHKVPRALAQQPLYGGASPERQLLDGLDTIDKQIGRLHERLAKDDLHALATHQRYLELKYNKKDQID